MWNDEDNNPYGAFDRQDPNLSESIHQASASPCKSAACCPIDAMPPDCIFLFRGLPLSLFPKQHMNDLQARHRRAPLHTILQNSCLTR